MLSLFEMLSRVPPLLASLLDLQPTVHTDGPVELRDHCPNPPALSCPFPPPPRSVNTCCVNHPSGHFLQTQFWDTSPAVGPDDSWTIHGLWPDLCTGGFDQFCDGARSHADIRRVLRHAVDDPEMMTELLGFMDRYWLSMDGDDAHLWAHEWNKHGTCISTLEPECYPRPSAGGHHHLDVLDYFVHTTSLFRTLDTFSILAEAGIVPSTSQTYSVRELEDAVSGSAHGQPVTFRCNRRHELDEVWYHFSVAGSLRRSTAGNDASVFHNATRVRQKFVPASPDGILTNCPRRGIKYLPKHPHRAPGAPPDPTRTATTTGTSTPTSAPFTGKGHLEIHVRGDSSQRPSPQTPPTDGQRPVEPLRGSGCLIRLGAWYTSGTCATFRVQRDVVDPGHHDLFSLSSSFSPCLVDPATGKFECTKSAGVQSIFSAGPDDPHLLAYHNRTTFYADHLPTRFEKVDIYADNADGERTVELEIRWVPV